jgi:putative oxidoreductase
MKDDGMHDLALLAARTVVGTSIAAHGAQKLLGWFGGPGIEGESQVMQSLGFTPGEQYARAAALAEIGAGALIVTGAGGPIGPALLLSVMVTATGSVHWKNGWFNQAQGFELNATYALLALLLAVEDHGALSLDQASGLRKQHRPLFGWLALAAGAGAAAYMLSRRTVPAQMETQAEPPAARSSEHGTVEGSSAFQQSP